METVQGGVPPYGVKEDVAVGPLLNIMDSASHNPVASLSSNPWVALINPWVHGLH